MNGGHSGFAFQRKLPLVRAAIIALTAMIAALGLLIVPAGSSAKTRPANAVNRYPAGLARTGEPPAAPAHRGYTAAPPATSVPDPGPTPASTGPPPPPVSRGTPIPCPLEWCQKLIEHFCHRFDCAKLSAEFRGTATEGNARTQLKHDKAFQQPWGGTGFEVHHIVPQGEACSGAAEFAQSLLTKVGITANDPENLAVLRGKDRQVGKPGYKELSPDLKRRMAHADTRPCYYYQKVNERFAEWQRAHGGAGGRLPNEAEVRAILRSIKRDLYNGGKDFIRPGVRPRSVDRAAA